MVRPWPRHCAAVAAGPVRSPAHSSVIDGLGITGAYLLPHRHLRSHRRTHLGAVASGASPHDLPDCAVGWPAGAGRRRMVRVGPYPRCRYCSPRNRPHRLDPLHLYALARAQWPRIHEYAPGPARCCPQRTPYVPGHGLDPDDRVRRLCPPHHAFLVERGRLEFTSARGQAWADLCVHGRQDGFEYPLACAHEGSDGGREEPAHRHLIRRTQRHGVELWSRWAGHHG